MQFLAIENVAVAYVRGRVPEFEPTFARLLDEDGLWELGSITTFDELARWLVDGAPDDVATRAFQAVEFVFTEKTLRVGNDEAVEFFETLAQEGQRRPARLSELRALWGEPTQGWMTSFRPDLVPPAGPR